MNTEKIIRIVISPFIFIFYCLAVVCGFLIPIPYGLLVMICWLHVIAAPFIELLKMSGVNIEHEDSCMRWPNGEMMTPFTGNFAMATSPFWGPFYGTYVYIDRAEFLF